MNTFIKIMSLHILGFALLTVLEATAEEDSRAESNEAGELSSDLHITPRFSHSQVPSFGSPTTNLRRESLVSSSASTIGDAVRNEPGVTTSYFGPSASRPIIRGNGNTRVKVLNNGLDSQDVSNLSEDHQTTVNPLSVESVEILKGPAMLLYGSAASGGVVRTEDTSIAERNYEKPIQGEVLYRHGSVNDENSGAVLVEGNEGNFNAHVSGFYQEGNNLEIPGYAESDRLRMLEHEEDEEHLDEDEGHDHEEGEEVEVKDVLPNSFFRNRGFTIGMSRTFDPGGFVGASLSGLDSRYGIPGHGHGEGDAHEGEHELENPLEAEEGHLLEEGHEEDEHGHSEEEGVLIELEQWRGAIHGGIDVENSRVTNIHYSVGVSNYDHKEIEDGSVATIFEQDSVDSRFELAHSIADGVRGLAGLQMQFTDLTVSGEEAFIPSNTQFAPAVFLFEEWEASDFVDLQVGGRIEYVSIDPESRGSETFTPFGVSFAAKFYPESNKLYELGSTLSYSERAPSALELFAEGRHLARQIYERGDSSLDVEKNIGLDLSFAKNAGFVTGSVTSFVDYYEDYINLSNSGEELDGFPVFVYDDIRAAIWGVELLSVFHLHELANLWAHDIDLELQGDFLRGRNISDSEHLPRMPPWRLTSRLKYGYKNYFDAGIEGIFVAKQDKLAPDELATDDHFLLNAGIDVIVFGDNEREVKFFTQVANITDQEARVHTSFLKDLAPLPGRSVLFGVRGVF